VITKYSYGDRNKEDEIGRVCGRHRGKINAYRVLVGKAEGKKTLRGPRNRQKDNNNVTGTDRKACSGLISGSKEGQVTDCFDVGQAHSGSIENMEQLD